jgi:hypothetical protein
MRFAFKLGDIETARVEFYRNPWVGTMRITADGQQVAFVDHCCKGLGEVAGVAA